MKKSNNGWVVELFSIEIQFFMRSRECNGVNIVVVSEVWLGRELLAVAVVVVVKIIYVQEGRKRQLVVNFVVKEVKISEPRVGIHKTSYANS